MEYVSLIRISKINNKYLKGKGKEEVERLKDSHFSHGLGRQRMIVESYVNSVGGSIIKEFKEIDSGTKKGNRKKALEAINFCLEHKKDLIVSSLDRLTRDVPFLYKTRDVLSEGNIKIVFADMPHADKAVINMMAVIAELEAERISERTKDALQWAKKMGVKLGSPKKPKKYALKAAHAQNKKLALENENNIRATAFISECMKNKRKDNGVTFSSIATQLNANGYTTSRGGQFYASQVKNLYDRSKKCK